MSVDDDAASGFITLEVLAGGGAQDITLALVHVNNFEQIANVLGNRTADRTLRALADRLLDVEPGAEGVFHLDTHKLALLLPGGGGRLEAYVRRTHELPDEPIEHLMPPFCDACQLGFVRPGVVWFGESLPVPEWTDAETHARHCDLMVVVGTSGVVFPAAGLPLMAVSAGIPVIEISPEDTEFTPHATYSWRTTADTGLPALAAAVGVGVGA